MKLFVALSAVTVILSSCSTSSKVDTTKETLKMIPTRTNLSDRKFQVDRSKPKFCAALRGNGIAIYGLFGSLARIVETYGTVDGIAGGSSGSITAFIYESMLLNPSLEGASEREMSEKMALMLKSTVGYLQALQESSEFVALFSLLDLGEKLDKEGIDGLSLFDLLTVKSKLRKVLSDPMYTGLINTKMLSMLDVPGDYGYKSEKYLLKEIINSLKSLTDSSYSDPRILFRVSPISFPGLARVLDRIANFYSGYAFYDKTKWNKFLNRCSAGTKGKIWSEIEGKSIGFFQTCGGLFASLVGDYTDSARDINFVFVRRRINDTLGKRIPSFVPVGVLRGEKTIGHFLSAQDAYRKNKFTQLKINFNNFRMGYFGPVSFRESMATNFKSISSEDPKVSKLYNINQSTPALWSQVLALSPAEPSLSSAIVVSDSMAFVGGWADLSPMQTLRAAGCEQIIYVTRRGDEAGIVTSPNPIKKGQKPTGVAQILGMTRVQQKNLYDLSNPRSGFSLALKKADAVWCTDWDKHSPDPASLFAHGYGTEHRKKTDPFQDTKLIAKSAFFTGELKYLTLASDKFLRGCSTKK